MGGRERKKHIKKSEYKKVHRPPEKQRKTEKNHPIEPAEKLHNPQQKILILEPACDALGRASRSSQLVYDIYNFFSYILMRYSTARGGYSQPEEGERESESDMLWVEQFFFTSQFYLTYKLLFFCTSTHSRGAARGGGEEKKNTKFFSPHSA